MTIEKRKIQYLLFIVWLFQVTVSQPIVHILSPQHGVSLSSDVEKAVKFEFSLSLEGTSLSRKEFEGDNPVYSVCFTVQNKRHSYHAFTQCIPNVDQPFFLSGVTFGVWCVRAYIILNAQQKDNEHWRGGHKVHIVRENNHLELDDDKIISGQHYISGRGTGVDTIWFMMDETRWREEAHLTTNNGISNDLRQGIVTDKDIKAYRRLSVFRIVNAMARSSSIRSVILNQASKANIQQVAGISIGSKLKSTPLVVAMCNEGHLSLALNLLFSLRKYNVLEMFFALDIASSVALAVVEATHVVIPTTASGLNNDLSVWNHDTLVDNGMDSSGAVKSDLHKDVWSKGFADIAVLKPACLLTMLKLGVDALWMDTDIVLFRNPFQELFNNHIVFNTGNVNVDNIKMFEAEISQEFDNNIGGGTSERDEAPDFAFQVGGSQGNLMKNELDVFREELCTGLYYVRSSVRSMRLLEQVIHIMALKEEDVRFGDQAATNIILFESMWRDQGDDRNQHDFNQLLDDGIRLSSLNSSHLHHREYSGETRVGLGLKVLSLNQLLFPSGDVYFDAQLHLKYGVNPVLVHNNFLIGKQLKIDRFKKHGLWYLSPIVNWTREIRSNSHFKSQEPENSTHTRLSSSQSTSIHQSLDFFQNMTFSFVDSLFKCSFLDHLDFHSDNISKKQCKNISENRMFLHPYNGDSQLKANGSGSKLKSLERRVMFMISVGHRPWFKLVQQRLMLYAARFSSDLVFIRKLSYPSQYQQDNRQTEGNINDGINLNVYAKQVKLIASRELLESGYDRVVVIDDTMLLRSDAPNLFSVPSRAIGASVETDIVRSHSENRVLMRLALIKYWPCDDLIKSRYTSTLTPFHGRKCVDDLLLKYNDVFDLFNTHIDDNHGTETKEESTQSFDDFRWFNSGLVVYSKYHLPLFRETCESLLSDSNNVSSTPSHSFEEVRPCSELSGKRSVVSLDKVSDSAILWDQGWINAQRVLHRVPLHDLGLKFNWLGSFNGSNAASRPCEVSEAYGVHATTGLPDFGKHRVSFIQHVDTLWKDQGL